MAMMVGLADSKRQPGIGQQRPATDALIQPRIAHRKTAVHCIMSNDEQSGVQKPAEDDQGNGQQRMG